MLLSIFKRVVGSSIVISGLTFACLFSLSVVANDRAFGLFNTAYATLLMLVNFFTYGVLMRTTVFLGQGRKIKTGTEVATTVRLVQPMLVAVVFPLGIIIGIAFNLQLTLVFAIIVMAMFMARCLVMINIFRAALRFRLFAIFQIIYVLLLFSPFLVYKDSVYFARAAIIGAFGFGVYAVILKVVTQRIGILHQGSPKRGRNLLKLRIALRRGFTLMLSNILMSSLIYMDKLLLATSASIEDVGVYSKAFVISSIILFVINNFASSWGLYLSRKLNHFKGITARRLRNYIGRGSLIVLTASVLSALILPFVNQVAFDEMYCSADVSCDGNEMVLVAVLTISFLVFLNSKYLMGYTNVFLRNKHTVISSGLALTSMVCCFYIFQVSTPTQMSYVVFASFIAQWLYLFIYTFTQIPKLAKEE